jgi:hypothetical protein
MNPASQVSQQTTGPSDSSLPLRSVPVEAPEGRRLRVYAFDPSLSARMDTSLINHATLTVPWEDDLKPGPVGEYIEVVDVDPGSDCAYLPVDLNNPYLLARGGLDPSEGNPQFHQQMVYAVAMYTLRNFEKSLGRVALWSPRPAVQQPDGTGQQEEYVRRLRLYPHALRERNAYYSPQKKALLFGYFPAMAGSSGPESGEMVFTCLAQDVVAHETAHALLDGMHPRFIERTNLDTHALHEAFADIVAIFQRFAMPELVRHQIARTRGDLGGQQHLLSEIAQQFGLASGQHEALRSALGKGAVNPKTGVWEPEKPDPAKLAQTSEPHARGGILMAAVFDAFLAIHRSRIEDLVRIATGGSGILPAGNISPDLVGRLASEASKSAQHVLNMCIRAMDYLPPVDVTFGDYLRALITADYDLVPNDTRQYRLAFQTAFQARGIYPQDIRSLSVDTLRWRSPQEMGESADALEFGQKLTQQLQSFANEWRLTGRTYESERAAQEYIQAMGAVAGPRDQSEEGPNQSGTYRESVFLKSRRMRRDLHKWLAEMPDHAKNVLLGLNITPGPDSQDAFQVHAIRPVRRVGPDDRIIQQMIFEVTQKCPEWLEDQPLSLSPTDKPPGPDFYFLGGATVIADLETGAIRYIVRKRIDDPARLQREREFRKTHPSPFAELDHATALRAAYFGQDGTSSEPFAMLHRSAPVLDAEDFDNGGIAR